MELSLLGAIAAGVAVILFLILYFRIQAFMALLIGSIVVGLLAGCLLGHHGCHQKRDGWYAGLHGGRGGGLGALFGAILEHSEVLKRLLVCC